MPRDLFGNRKPEIPPPRDEPITAEGLRRVASGQEILDGIEFARKSYGNIDLYHSKLRICFDAVQEHWNDTVPLPVIIKRVVHKFVSEYTEISQQRFKGRPADVDRLRDAYIGTVSRLCGLRAVEERRKRRQWLSPQLNF